jgi:hypothetical protein
MRSIALAAALIAGFALPAHAQGRAPHPDDIAAKQRAEEADKGYRIMLEATKGRASDGKVDPWANIRPAEAAPAPKGKKAN